MKRRKSAHDSQIVSGKENPKLSNGWPSYSQATGTIHRLKLYARAVIESEALPTIILPWVAYISKLKVYKPGFSA